MIRFLVHVAEKQILEGRRVAFERPSGSALWDQPDIRALLDDPCLMEVSFNMCSFNLRAKSDDGPLRKPTTVWTTDENYVKVLDRPCAGDHDRTRTEGQNTKPAGQYAAEFGKTVMEGHKKTRLDRERAWATYVAERGRACPARQERPLQRPSQDLSMVKIDDFHGWHHRPDQKQEFLWHRENKRTRPMRT